MDTIKIGTIPFILSIAVICIIETAACKLDLPPLMVIGIARCLEIVFILAVFFLFYKKTAPLGLARKQILPGLKKGLIWSAGFGAVSAVIGLCLVLCGINPFQLIHASLPDTVPRLILFYFVGGIIAPIAEEIFFRGIIYGYIRGLLYDKLKNGAVLIALIVSTFLFVYTHQTSAGLPLPQLVGGIVFCICFEIEKKLATPMVIHCLGNVALFTISLF
ncbi:MAG: lysostaphin resistance A-like protein [Dissulfuribacterales bacterium]